MSTLQAANLSDGTDTVATGYVVNGSAKAWVSLNGTSTIAIRGSLNISSIVDNGTGDYTSNFTASFNANDYAMPSAGGIGSGATEPRIIGPAQVDPTTGLARMISLNAGGTVVDINFCTSSFIGDLA